LALPVLPGLFDLLLCINLPFLFGYSFILSWMLVTSSFDFMLYNRLTSLFDAKVLLDGLILFFLRGLADLETEEVLLLLKPSTFLEKGES